MSLGPVNNSNIARDAIKSLDSGSLRNNAKVDATKVDATNADATTTGAAAASAPAAEARAPAAAADVAGARQRFQNAGDALRDQLLERLPKSDVAPTLIVDKGKSGGGSSYGYGGKSKG